MVTESPTPRRVKSPSWFEPRIIAGLVLVLASVLIGAKVISSADSTRQMWSVTRDLEAGSVLTADDLGLVNVRVPDGVYLSAKTARDQLVGRSANRRLGKGELVPADVLAEDSGTRVTIPFAPKDAPKLARGQRVQVWLSTKSCAGVKLVNEVTIQEVETAGSGAFARGDGQTVVVRVSAELAERISKALAIDNAVLRAGILDGPAASATPLPSLQDCAAAK